MISRRSFLIAASTLGVGSLGLGSQVFANIKNTTNDLKLLESEIIIPTLPDSFDGFNIAILADPHLGTCSNGSLFTQAVDLLADKKLDLVVLSGDYILMLDLFASRFFYNRYSSVSKNRSCANKEISFKESQELGKYYFKEVATEASRLNPSHGILAVLGNHDRWNSADDCISILGSEGIEVLVNRAITISRGAKQLEFYGCDDYSTGIPQPPQTLNPNRIIISHNPDYLSELSDGNSFALGIAGHTHGGQINLPVIGPLALNIQDHRLIQGLSRIKQSQIFVSRGIGTSGLPWRINCPPEVNLLTLRSGRTQSSLQ